MDTRIDVAPIRCTNCHFFECSFSSSSDNCRVIISIPNKCIVTCRTGYFLYDVTERRQMRKSGEVSGAPF